MKRFGNGGLGRRLKKFSGILKGIYETDLANIIQRRISKLVTTIISRMMRKSSSTIVDSNVYLNCFFAWLKVGLRVRTWFGIKVKQKSAANRKQKIIRIELHRGKSIRLKSMHVNGCLASSRRKRGRGRNVNIRIILVKVLLFYERAGPKIKVGHDRPNKNQTS